MPKAGVKYKEYREKYGYPMGEGPEPYAKYPAEHKAEEKPNKSKPKFKKKPNPKKK